MASTSRTRTRETSAQRAQRELVELRAVAEAAGYVDPYPALGVAPVADIDKDRCASCRWTLFVAMDCAVYCINSKCEKFRYDLRQDVPDE